MQFVDEFFFVEVDHFAFNRELFGRNLPQILEGNSFDWFPFAQGALEQHVHELKGFDALPL